MALIDPVSSLSSALTRNVNSDLNTQSYSSALSTASSKLKAGISVAFSGTTALDKASELISDKTKLDQAITTVSTAAQGSSKLTSIFEEASQLAESALTATEDERKQLSEQFDNLLNQADQLSADSSYNGTNLLQKDSSYKLSLSSSSFSIEIKGFDASSAGLGVNKASGNWSKLDDIKAAISDLKGSEEAKWKTKDVTLVMNSNNESTESSSASTTEETDSTGAINVLRRASNQLNSNISMLKSRMDISTAYASSIASDMTAASQDLDPMDSSMLALKTKSPLLINSTSQNQQALMSLFK